MASQALGCVGALELESQQGRLVQSGSGVNARALELGANLRPLRKVVYLVSSHSSADDGLERLLEIMAQAVSAALRRSGKPRGRSAED